MASLFRLAIFIYGDCMYIRFIKPSFEIDMLGQTGIEKLKFIEKVSRTCYKSEENITDDSYVKFVKGLIKRDHTAMLEHESISVKFIVNRAFTHEIVRHRIGIAFAQESQRYVDYNNCIEFIIPSWSNITPWEINIPDGHVAGFNKKDNYDDCDVEWLNAVVDSAIYYTNLLSKGWKSEQARDVLPNACKTEICITANLREWRHIFKLRAHHTASPQMQELMIPLLDELKQLVPVVFDDLVV